MTHVKSDFEKAFIVDLNEVFDLFQCPKSEYNVYLKIEDPNFSRCTKQGWNYPINN